MDLIQKITQISLINFIIYFFIFAFVCSIISILLFNYLLTKINNIIEKARIFLFVKKNKLMFNWLTALSYYLNKIELSNYFSILKVNYGSQSIELLTKTYIFQDMFNIFSNIYFPLFLILLCIKYFISIKIYSSQFIDYAIKLKIGTIFIITENNHRIIQIAIAIISLIWLLLFLTKRISNQFRIYKAKDGLKNNEIELSIKTLNQLFNKAINEFLVIRNNLDVLQQSYNYIISFDSGNKIALKYDIDKIIISSRNQTFRNENDIIKKYITKNFSNSNFKDSYINAHEQIIRKNIYFSSFEVNKSINKYYLNLYWKIKLNKSLILSEECLLNRYGNIEIPYALEKIYKEHNKSLFSNRNINWEKVILKKDNETFYNQLIELRKQNIDYMNMSIISTSDYLYILRKYIAFYNKKNRNHNIFYEQKINK